MGRPLGALPVKPHKTAFSEIIAGQRLRLPLELIAAQQHETRLRPRPKISLAPQGETEKLPRERRKAKTEPRRNRAVRRQNIWFRMRCGLAESLSRPCVDVKRRSCGAASADVG